MTCDSCGKQGPEGPFCTYCGVRQGSAGQRPGAYAAHPSEPVYLPAPLTTLLPHLGSMRLNEFRLALGVGVGILVLLTAVGLVASALVAAIILVPVLYLLYLYDAQVYRDEPAAVIGVTLGGGIVVGVVVTLVLNALFGRVVPTFWSPAGVVFSIGGMLVSGLVIPAVQEVLKPLPALVLRSSPAFTNTIDGLTFGVTAGLGFFVAQAVIDYAQIIGNSSVQSDPAGWIYQLISLGVLIPLLQGTATGIVAASLWKQRNTSRAGVVVTGLVVAIAGHVLFSLGTTLLQGWAVTQLVWLTYQALIVGLLLVYARQLLHQSLIEEAEGMGLAQATCANCHQAVAAAGFCPHCGGSMHATPRQLQRSGPRASAVTGEGGAS